MQLPTLLEMATEGFGDRVAVGPREGGVTYAQLRDLARRAAVVVRRRGVPKLGLVDVNSEAVPVLLYGSGIAGVPFVPLNYRLDDDHLRTIAVRTAPSLLVVEDSVVPRVGRIDGVELLTRSAFLAELDTVDAGSAPATIADPDDAAVLLFTSGTTGEPKAAVLRHRHLATYVFDTVEYMGAGADEAALVSVPPYHVAGITAALTSVFAGRRLVYLPAFSPDGWVETAQREAVTQAMVVPTMLARIVDVIAERDERLTSLRHLAYGGGRMPIPVIERALTLLPDVGFVQAYGLTETSSTIAVLGPDDHRTAMASSNPSIRRRLGSVGRPTPTLQLEVRGEDGRTLGTNQTGEIFVRGEQVAGEYVDGAGLGDDGWFATRDAGYLDDDGYLYLTGRLDDVIVRGAENISPGEIEDVLMAHPAVAEAAVVGIPDVEWGETVAAVVVLIEGESATAVQLQDWVRSSLRSSKTPGRIEFRDRLPYTETGKVLRRALKGELVENRLKRD